jgi:hypothetical protein
MSSESELLLDSAASSVIALSCPPPSLQTYSYVVFFVVYEGIEEKAHGGQGSQIAVAKAIFQRCSSLES